MTYASRCGRSRASTGGGWRSPPTKTAPSLLRAFLLLASLTEQYLDQVETAMLLSNAWWEATRRGLDPSPFFKEAAALAGTRPVLHGQSAREFLEGFEPYS